MNQVGVELNTASAPLLARGRESAPGEKIVAIANTTVASRVGGPARCVGARPTHLRAGGGLPARSRRRAPARRERRAGRCSARRIAKELGVSVASRSGAQSPARYLGGDVGRFTMDDILEGSASRGRPARDVRAAGFRTTCRSGPRPGMGSRVVTSICFGAFVDVGVRDRLVHSQRRSLRQRPSDVVKVGDKLKVRVLDVDLARRRMSAGSQAAGPARSRAAGLIADSADASEARRGDVFCGAGRLRRPAAHPASRCASVIRSSMGPWCVAVSIGRPNRTVTVRRAAPGPRAARSGVPSMGQGSGARRLRRRSRPSWWQELAGSRAGALGRDRRARRGRTPALRPTVAPGLCLVRAGPGRSLASAPRNTLISSSLGPSSRPGTAPINAGMSTARVVGHHDGGAPVECLSSSRHQARIAGLEDAPPVAFEQLVGVLDRPQADSARGQETRRNIERVEHRLD